jgi:hypothetical protein
VPRQASFGIRSSKPADLTAPLPADVRELLSDTTWVDRQAPGFAALGLDAIGIRRVGSPQPGREELQVAANIRGGRQITRTDATPRDVVGDNADKMMPLAGSPRDRPTRFDPSGPAGVMFDAELVSHATHQDAPTLSADQVNFIDLEADIGAVDRVQLGPSTGSKDNRLIVHRVVYRKNKRVMTDDNCQPAHRQGFHQPPAFARIDVIQAA